MTDPIKPPIMIRFFAGKIYGKNKLRKMGAGAWNFICDTGKLIIGGGSKGREWGFPGEHRMVEGRFFQETMVPQFVGGKLKEPDQRSSASFVLVGSYIAPYISEVNDKEAQIITHNNKENGSAVSVLNIPYRTDAVNHHSKHYLNKHCYYNLRMFAEDFAKYYGVEPLPDGSGYGVHWKAYFINYVGWRILIQWDEELLTYDGLIKEELNEVDLSMMGVWVAKQLGKLAISMVGLGVAAAGGGAALAAGSLEGDKGISEAVDKNTEMQNKTFREHTGNPKDRDVKANWRKPDYIRLAKAISSKNVLMGYGYSIDVDNAKKGLYETCGNALAFKGMRRLFAGGKLHYQSGIKDWLAKNSALTPLAVDIRTSNHYETTWFRTMNYRIANYYFPFPGDAEISMKEGIGMEKGTARSVLTKLHGWVGFSSNIFAGNVSRNPLLDFWTKHDIFIYQETEVRPVLKVNDFYRGYSLTFTNTIADMKGGEIVDKYKVKNVITIENSEIAAHTFVFCLIWISNPNDVLFTPQQKGVFTIFPSSGSAYIPDLHCSTTGEEYLKVSLRKTLNRRVADGHLPSDSDKLKCSGRIGDPECGHEPTRWKGNLPNGGKSKDYPNGWSENVIKPFKDKEYMIVRWGKQKRGQFTFGHGKEGNTVVVRYLQGIPDEEQILTKKDSEHWVLGKFPGYEHMTLKAFEKKTEEIDKITSTITNPFGLEETISATAFDGLEGWGEENFSGFGGGGGGIDTAVPPLDKTLPSWTGGMRLPTIEQMKIDTQIPQELAQSMNEIMNIDVSVPLPEAFKLSQGMGVTDYIQVGQTEGVDIDLHSPLEGVKIPPKKETEGPIAEGGGSGGKGGKK